MNGVLMVDDGRVRAFGYPGDLKHLDDQIAWRGVIYRNVGVAVRWREARSKDGERMGVQLSPAHACPPGLWNWLRGFPNVGFQGNGAALISFGDIPADDSYYSHDLPAHVFESSEGEFVVVLPDFCGTNVPESRRAEVKFSEGRRLGFAGKERAGGDPAHDDYYLLVAVATLMVCLSFWGSEILLIAMMLGAGLALALICWWMAVKAQAQMHRRIILGIAVLHLSLQALWWIVGTAIGAGGTH